MTAYGAMESLMNTINNILHCSRFSLVDSSEHIIQVVSIALRPWQGILERLDETRPSRSRKKVNALDGRIKEAIWKFEDSLESLLIQHIPSQLETLRKIISIDLQSLQSEVHSLIETLKVMEKDYIYEVENMPQDEPISSSIGFHGANTEMIGLSDQFQKLKSNLIMFEGNRDELPLHVFIPFYVLIGTAGVGKTTLAMQIYQDPEIHSKFERRAWVTVGRVPQPINQILCGILPQLCGIGITEGDEETVDSLKERLHGKNCLIVLDDVWDKDAWDSVKYFCKGFREVRIQVLLTARHRQLIDPYIPTDYWYEVRFMNEEESMELLCEKVFGDEICPPQLHKVAAKIAKRCEGLPLLIVTVACIISISEHNRDPVYWNDVAERRNSVFRDAYNKISKVLFPSYDYLLQRLKMPFLFMGVFPREYNTPTSKIISMLMAQGLLYWYKWGCYILKELVYDYTLVLRILKSVNKNDDECHVEEYKTCRLHSSWQHVCREEASKNKFYHVLNKLTDAEEKVLKGQRGLCVENNILFGIKDFRDSVRLNCASFARFLLFYGPYHQYPIHIDVGFMLLREIDALTQRFYTFPEEILTQVQLKYLALTCNGEVPPTISKLFNLRVLIIHPHMKIRRRGAPSYVPIQVWDMQELEHMEILGKSLVAPSHVVSLKKLSTLVGVNASVCTIFNLSQRIPNIKKLGLQIELTPYEDHNDLLSCIDCISTLESLKTLKVSITNPAIKKGRVFPVTRRSVKWPRYLKKLHLSGMGFPWKYMNDIASSLSLEVLKLRSYAFQGSHLNLKGYSFMRLKFLLIEESDLVKIRTLFGSFIGLGYLRLKQCYKIKYIQIPSITNISQDVELEDCNPLALTWARKLRPGHVCNTLRVASSSSFDEKLATIKFEKRTLRYISTRNVWECTSYYASTGEAGFDEEFRNQFREDDEGDGADEENDDEYMDDHGDTDDENEKEKDDNYMDDCGDRDDENEEENDDEYMDDHGDTDDENEEENGDEYTYDHEDTEASTNAKEHENCWRF